MKNLIVFGLMIFAFNGLANIEYSPEAVSKPSQTEIDSNRACFQDLEELGCGDSGEDVENFRSCMNNVYSSLDKSCQKLMNDLYK